MKFIWVKKSMFKDFEILMIEKGENKNKRTTIIMVGKNQTNHAKNIYTP